MQTNKNASLLSRIVSKTISLARRSNEIRYIVEEKTLKLETSSPDNALLRAVISDAMKWRFDQCPEKKLGVFVFENSRWKKSLDKEPRYKDSVVFENNLMQNLLEDARVFYLPDTQRDYTKKCIPYRRGYLLHGPPGCGKTSFIAVLASELNRDLSLV